jgi:hypothetical protein
MESVELMAKIKPKGGGTFAMVDAADIDMGDDVRLPEALDEIRESLVYPIVEGKYGILPEHYHVFGEVDALSVTLLQADDDRAHEYCFEFIPTENFVKLTIMPQPKWVSEPQFIAGKTHQVSILRGIGVMACA